MPRTGRRAYPHKPTLMWRSHAHDFTPIVTLPSRPSHSLAAFPRPSPPLLSSFTSHAHRRARERLSAAIPPRLISLLHSLSCPSHPPHTLVFTLIAVLAYTRFPSLPLDTRPSRQARGPADTSFFTFYYVHTCSFCTCPRERLCA